MAGSPYPDWQKTNMKVLASVGPGVPPDDAEEKLENECPISNKEFPTDQVETPVFGHWTFPDSLEVGIGY